VIVFWLHTIKRPNQEVFKRLCSKEDFIGYQVKHRIYTNVFAPDTLTYLSLEENSIEGGEKWGSHPFEVEKWIEEKGLKGTPKDYSYELYYNEEDGDLWMEWRKIPSF
jgi:hypothetical protein